jgi:hypothetical protein
MIRYRPTYKFCRTANTMDMLLYINDKLVAFRKGFSNFPDRRNLPAVASSPAILTMPDIQRNRIGI